MITYITQDAPRTFLIILSILDFDPLAWMASFQWHGFDDSCLPIKMPASWDPDLSECNVCTQATRQEHDKHSPLQAFDHDFWDYTCLRRFYDTQFSFVLQEFNVDQFRYEELHDDQSLPIYLEAGSPTEAGSVGTFSEVQEGWILTSHLKCDCVEACTHIYAESKKRIAIKILKPLTQNSVPYDIAAEWGREVAAFMAFNSLNQKRIVRGLAAFKQRGQYYILMEWANCGSLRKLWDRWPRPEFSPGLVRQVIRELHGLADALCCMHEISRFPNRADLRDADDDGFVVIAPDGQQSVSSRTNSLSSDLEEESHRMSATTSRSVNDTPPTIPMLQVNSEQISNLNFSSRRQRNFRHGDIKPDNILWHVAKDEMFCDGLNLGTLILADLGRAKEHQDPTHIREGVEIDDWHTKTYEPPENINSMQTTSRLYDIWSMGCVFYEVILWMLYGQKAIKKFKETQPIEFSKNGSFYWTRSAATGTAATVSQTVAVWMDEILKSDPECNRRSAVGDLMKLVRDKMLVVNLGGRYEQSGVDALRLDIHPRRASARVVRDELQKILDDMDLSPGYCFTGADRSHARPPSSQDPLGLPQQSASLTPGESQGEMRQTNLIIRSSDTLRQTSATSTPLTVLRRQYTHRLTDAWWFEDDDDFATNVLQNLGYKSRPSRQTGLFVHDACRSFNPAEASSFQPRSLQELVAASKNCKMCHIIAKKALEAGIALDGTIAIDRRGSRLRINGKDDIALRVCRSLGMAITHSLYSNPSSNC
jgi:serine/threonine protein kinase